MSLLNMIPKLDPDDVFTVCPPATSKMISQKFNFYNDRPILRLSYLIDNSLATPFVNTYHSYSLIENKQIETYNKNNLQTTKKINFLMN